jgi:DNA-binding NtrC family response regulator
MSRPRVLIVDDDAGIRKLCSTICDSAGLESFTAGDAEEAVERLASVLPEFVLLDVNLPGRSGMELLREIRVRFPATKVVIITGYAAVDLAVDAMKLGAYDYIAKPFSPKRLLQVLTDSAPPKQEAVREHGGAHTRSFCGLVGVSAALQQIFELIDKAAQIDSTVLVEGESGTGKELVARGIHARSGRATDPFVPVDCGAIPDNLIESELFGHVAGSFTDAKENREGLLRSAGDGSIFLDEIGELPQAVQVKLLRALQQMEVRPVGSTRPEPFRARIIAATNRNLSEEVARGSFRRDLFYRLHVVPIFLPPLRERREDVPVLIEHFLRMYGDRSPRQLSISPDALRHLIRYDWPGNIRELENTVQRAFALVDGDEIELSDMAVLFPRQSMVAASPTPPQTPPQTQAHTAEPAASTLDPVESSRGNLMAQQEAETIQMAIVQANGNKREAARVLGIGIATLYRKLKKYGIST